MSQVTTPTEPGWLPDPSGRYEWRYWDGGWTNRVANSAPAAEPTADRSRRRRCRLRPWTPRPSPRPRHRGPGRAARRRVAPRSPHATRSRACRSAPIRRPAPRPPSQLRPGSAGARRGRSSSTSSARSPTSPSRTTRRSRASRCRPIPAGERMVATAPGNYGHAMIVALAAVGIVAGAYLPWVSGTIGLAQLPPLGLRRRPRRRLLHRRRGPRDQRAAVGPHAGRSAG